MRRIAPALVLMFTTAVGSATTKPAATTKPTTEPTTRAATPHTWKWSNQTLATDEKINELKESLVGKTSDEMYAALKDANFAPPEIKSRTADKVVYEAGAIVDEKAVFQLVTLRIEVGAGTDKVTKFTEKRKNME